MHDLNQPDRPFLQRQQNDKLELLVMDNTGETGYRFCTHFRQEDDARVIMARETTGGMLCTRPSKAHQYVIMRVRHL